MNILKSIALFLIMTASVGSRAEEEPTEFSQVELNEVILAYAYAEREYSKFVSGACREYVTERLKQQLTDLRLTLVNLESKVPAETAASIRNFVEKGLAERDQDKSKRSQEDLRKEMLSYELNPGFVCGATWMRVVDFLKIAQVKRRTITR